MDPKSEHDREEFITSYKATAIWSTTHTPDDIDGVEQDPVELDTMNGKWHEKTLKKVNEDCNKFMDDNAELLSHEEVDAGHAGHDFWLTRAHHGAGYWDGDYPVTGDALTEAVKKDWPNLDLYLGDDGYLYF